MKLSGQLYETNKFFHYAEKIHEIFGLVDFEAVLGKILIKLHRVASVEAGFAEVIFRIFHSG